MLKYDLYAGILAPNEMAALSSIKMATALGQLLLASSLKKIDVPARVYNLDVTKLDRAEKDIVTFISQAKRPLAGLTLVAGNVPNSLKLARWLKSIGCDVIVGGPEVTVLTVHFYASLDDIDGAVIGLADDVMPSIMRKGLEADSNVVTSQALSCSDSRRESDFNRISIDYGLLFRLAEDHGGVSYIWGGDCHLRNNRCFFCSRILRGSGLRPPSRVWRELKLPLQCGIRHFYNSADSVAVQPDEFAKLVRTRPRQFADTVHKTFVNATQVDGMMAELLAEFNALAAVGIESFSNIEQVGKGNTTVNDSLRAIELLYRHDVKMVLTFVLGLPGETRESLQKNSEVLLKVIDKYGDRIFMVTVSPLLVTIGSRAFDDMASEIGGDFPVKNPAEFYNPLLLSNLYYRKSCLVERQQIIDCIAELNSCIYKACPTVEFDSKGISPREKELIHPHS